MIIHAKRTNGTVPAGCRAFHPQPRQISFKMDEVVDDFTVSFA